MTNPTNEHREQAREITGAVVRTRRIGRPKSAARQLPFACRECGGRWRLKGDAEECCQAVQCNREIGCPARSHYGDCKSLPHSNVTMRITSLAKDCNCQGGWICPACANLLRLRDEHSRRLSRDAEIKQLLEKLARRLDPDPDGIQCWCPKALEPHTEACVETQVLYAKLQALQSENPGDTVRE